LCLFDRIDGEAYQAFGIAACIVIGSSLATVSASVDSDSFDGESGGGVAVVVVMMIVESIELLLCRWNE